MLMPDAESTGGISRKIEDEEERKKLKEIIAQLDLSSNMGVIVRTVGLNRNKTELQRDLAYLERLWASIQEKKQRIFGAGFDLSGTRPGDSLHPRLFHS